MEEAWPFAKNRRSACVGRMIWRCFGKAQVPPVFSPKKLMFHFSRLKLAGLDPPFCLSIQIQSIMQSPQGRPSMLPCPSGLFLKNQLRFTTNSKNEVLLPLKQVLDIALQHEVSLALPILAIIIGTRPGWALLWQFHPWFALERTVAPREWRVTNLTSH